MFAHPREFEHIAGHALVLHQCGFARVHRLERAQLRAGNAELRTQVPPQRCTHHAFGVEQSATESQKTDVQRQPKLMRVSATRVDDIQFGAGKREESLQLEGA